MANIGYSPDTATAVAIGATSGGWVSSQSPSWDDSLVYINMRAVEQRALLAWDMQLRLSAQMAAMQAEALEEQQGSGPVLLSVLGIGDSITGGVGSYDALGYRSVLASMLRANHIDAGSPIPRGGSTGFTLRDIAPQVPGFLAQYDPDVVLLNLGTNDAAQPDMADWQNRYGQLVDQILAFSPNVKVACARVMLSTPSWSSGEATINGYVDAVVAARQAGGRVVAADLTQLDAHVLAGADGVHPTSVGYALMAGIWYRAIWPWLP